MKNLITLAILLYTTQVFSQSHEIYGGFGISNYYGDLNTNDANSSFFSLFSEMDLKYSHPSYGLGYRYNFKKLFSLGLGFNYTNIDGADRRNEDAQPYTRNFYRRIRNLSFYSPLWQVALDFKVEPWRTVERWERGRFMFSPYIGAGLSIFGFNPKTQLNGVEYNLQQFGTEGQGTTGKPDKYSLTQFGIPLSLGFKLIPGNRIFSINANFAYTFTFTDYLDDVSTVYANPSILSTTGAQLAERRGEIDPTNTYAYITAPGEKRGTSGWNDNFLISQIQFSFYFNQARKAPYYNCCKFD